MTDVDAKALLDQLLAQYHRLRQDRQRIDVMLSGEGAFAIALAIRHLADVIERSTNKQVAGHD